MSRFFSYFVILAFTLIQTGRADSRAANPDISVTDTSKGIELVHNETEKRVDVFIDGHMVTSYIYPGEPLKKPVLYPVKTLSGKVLTRGFPFDPVPGERVDHPHHIGFWFNYGDVNGLDFWNNSNSISDDRKPRMGTIVHRSVDRVESGAEQGILEVTMEWVNVEGKALLRENTSFVFRKDEAGWSVDRITRLTALEGVSFTDNKEGVIGIRVTRALEHPSDEPLQLTDAEGLVQEVKVLDNEGVTGMYTNNEGITGTDVWGKRSDWVTLAGTIEDEPVALTLFDHPENVGYPTYWHARGYGLFAANPLGQEVFSEGAEVLNFRLESGASTTFRHRLLVTNGTILDPAAIRTRYEVFTR